MLSLNDSENYELPSVKYRYIKLRIKKTSKMSMIIWIVVCDIGMDKNIKVTRNNPVSIIKVKAKQQHGI